MAGLAVAAAVAACGDSGSSASSGAGVAGGGYAGLCSQYTTCGSCTPVVGCGWCFNATGGTCAAGPDECAFGSSVEFTWTWDPSGCPDVDASVHPAPPASGHDAGAPEASSLADAPFDAGVVEASTGADAGEEP